MGRHELIAVTTGLSILPNDENNRNPNEDLDTSQCAELETLEEYLKKENQEDVAVHLIYVKDTKGEIAVNMIKNALHKWTQEKRFPFSKIESIQTHPVELDVYNNMRPDSFLNTLFYLRQKALEENKDFCIIASGGYKVMFYYATLFGKLFKERVVYKYQSTKNLIYMPELPIYWDMRELETKTVLFRAREFKDTNYYPHPILQFLSQNYDTIRDDLLYHEPTLKYVDEPKLRSILKNNKYVVKHKPLIYTKHLRNRIYLCKFTGSQVNLRELVNLLKGEVDNFIIIYEHGFIIIDIEEKFLDKVSTVFKQ